MASDANGGFFRNMLSGQSRGASAPVSDHDHYQHIGQIRNQAKPGDILEFQRGSYTHYALFLGDGKVLNIDVEQEKSTEAHIRERTLQEVCDGCKVRIKSHGDVAQSVFHLAPKASDDTVRAAMPFKNKVVPYEHDFRNGEYYCTLWKYGKGFSTQVAEQTGAIAELEDGPVSTDTCAEVAGYAKYLKFNEGDDVAAANGNGNSNGQN